MASPIETVIRLKMEDLLSKAMERSQASIAGLGNELTKTGEKAHRAGGLFDGFLGGLAKVGLAAQGFVALKDVVSGTVGSLLKAAAEEQVGMERLAQAVRNAGGDWSKLGGTIEGQIAQWEKLTAFSDGQMRDALSLLTAQTGDADEAMKRLPIAMDFARGAGVDLATASKLLGKVTDETTNVLGRYGIRVEKGADATEVLRVVQEKFAGQSEAFAKTASGQWQIFHNQMDNLKEDLGTALVPIATRAFAGLVAGIDKVHAAGPLLSSVFRLIKADLTGVSHEADGVDEQWTQLFGVSMPKPLYDLANILSVTIAKIRLSLGSLGEMFDVLTGRRPEAGGMLSDLIGRDKGAEVMTALAGVRDGFKSFVDFLGGGSLKADALKDSLLGLGVVIAGFKVVELEQSLAALTRGLAMATAANYAHATSWLAVAAAEALAALPLVAFAALAAGIVAATAFIVTHLDDLSASWQALWGIVGVVAKNIAETVGASFSQIGKVVRGLVDGIGQAKDDAIAGTTALAQDVAAAIGQFIGLTAAAVGGAFSALGAAVDGMIKAVIAGVGGLFSSIGSAVHDFLTFWDGVWGEISGRPLYWLGRLLGFASGQMLNLAQSFGDTAGAMGRTLVEWASNVATTLIRFFAELPGNVATFLGSVAGTIIGFVGDAYARWSEWIRATATAIYDFLRALPGNVGRFLGSLVDALGTWARSMLDRIGQFAADALRAFGRWLSDTWDDVSRFFRDLPGRIWGFLSSLPPLVLDLSLDFLRNVAKWLGDVGSAIADFFVALPGKLWQFAQDAVQGFIDGIGSMIEKVKKVVADFVDGFLTGLKDALGIHSPAEETRKLGLAVAEGLALGVESGTGLMGGAAAKLVGSMTASLRAQIDALIARGAAVQITPSTPLGGTGPGMPAVPLVTNPATGQKVPVNAQVGSVIEFFNGVAISLSAAAIARGGIAANLARFHEGGFAVRGGLAELKRGEIVLDPERGGFGGGITFQRGSIVIQGNVDSRRRVEELADAIGDVFAQRMRLAGAKVTAR